MTDLGGLAFREGSFRAARILITPAGKIRLEAHALGAPGAPPARGGPGPRGVPASDPASPLVILPGFVNAHSHAFQRVLRGRTEGARNFWSWRERMYHAALQLEPEDVRIASRAAFLEMLLAGFTGVIEFHYLHHDSRGRPYADPATLSLAVLEAAAQVGIRICLLETAYARGDHGGDLDAAQRRFADRSLEAFLRRTEAVLAHGGGRASTATFGLALHSVRALPREWLKEIGAWATSRQLPLHMHVAEQASEIERCLAEHGRRPVELLDELGILGARFTAVHAIHLSAAEIELLARSESGVCACPSTEGNLGDGVVPAAELFERGVPVCVGTDSHAAIDPFAEMRELDYRERLRSGSRRGAAAAGQLLQAATEVGAERAGWLMSPAPVRGQEINERAGDAGISGRIENEMAADLAVLDGEHPTLAGADADSLADHLVITGSPGLVKDVYVGGRQVIENGRHAAQEEILRDFVKLQRRLWGVVNF